MPYVAKKRIIVIVAMKKNERLPINSDLLQTFVAIAQCGNLTVAAGQLGRTQSAISVQLQKLESGFGVPLFLRTPKGMTLNASGERILPRAKAILAEMRETANLFSEPLTGSIRVGVPDDFDEAVLEHVLKAFSRAHPGVQVTATSGCTSGFAAAIDNHELDVAVCSGPDNHRGKLLNVEEIVWATQKDAKLKVQDTIPLAVLDRNCWWGSLPSAVLDAAGINYEVAFRSGSFSSLQAALRAGFAIGLLPKSSVSPELKVMTARDGFPQLPKSRLTILVSDELPDTLASAMVEAIVVARDAAGNQQGGPPLHPPG